MAKIVRALDRLLKKRWIDPETGCWLFTGYVIHGRGKYAAKSGYAYIRDDHRGDKKGALILVHRLAYRELVGKIPAGMEVDHNCCTRHCFNPEHLTARTRGVHIALTVFRNQLGQLESIPF